MAMLLRGMAAEFVPGQVRVNGVFPEHADPALTDPIAHLVRFLAGQGANYITGAMLRARPAR